MDHVATEPLSRMTFRSLANALGVSTYSFVYHFGSRQEMIDAILEEGVRHVRDALHGPFPAAVLASGVLDGEQVDMRSQRHRERAEVTGRPSGVREADQPQSGLRRGDEPPHPGVLGDSVVRHRYTLRSGRPTAAVLSSRVRSSRQGA